MGKIDSTNSEQLDFNRLGEAYFDCASVIAQSGSFKYALRGQGKPYKTFIVETAPDRNGNSSGYVDVYLGSAVNGSPWRTIAIGGGRSGPVPAVDFVTLVPRAGTVGTVSITLSTEIWGSYFRKPATATYFPLEDLTDVVISSPVAGQTLTWNGTDWVNESFSETLENLSDVAITAPVNNQVLTYESGVWVNRAGGSGSSAFDTAALALSNLTHYWKCNDAAGVTGLLDSVGVANLTITGNAKTQGRCLCRDAEPGLQTFGGGTDGASIAKNLILPASTASPFSLFFVVRVLTTQQIQNTSVAQTMILCSDVTTNTVQFDMRAPAVSGGSTPSLVGYIGSQNSEGTGFRQLTPGSLSTFLAVITDDGAGNTSLYVDGALLWTLTSSYSRTGTLYFMNDTVTSPSSGAAGTIAKIGVVNAVMTQTQMLSLVTAM